MATQSQNSGSVSSPEASSSLASSADPKELRGGRPSLGSKLLKLLLAAFATLVLFELVGQTLVFRDKLYFVNDVDHRMEPFSADDINSDGIRSRVEATSFPEEAHNILFLGDSFVYGFRLELEESVPYQLESIARERHPGQAINVANFGWISSAPVLSERLLRDLGAKYNPDVVILGLDMSDFEDEAKYRRLLERPGIYRLLHVVPISFLAAKRIVRKVGPLQPLHEEIFGYPARRFFVTAHPREEVAPYYDEVRKSLDRLAATSADLGARFILVVFPRNYQYSDRESPNNWEGHYYEVLGPYAHEPFEYFDQLRSEVEYPIYSLLEDFQQTEVFPTCLEFDPHWTPAGARVAAEAVYEDCLAEGCFGSGEGENDAEGNP